MSQVDRRSFFTVVAAAVWAGRMSNDRPVVVAKNDSQAVSRFMLDCDGDSIDVTVLREPEGNQGKNS